MSPRPARRSTAISPVAETGAWIPEGTLPAADPSGAARGEAHHHAVQFYDDDGFLATVVGEFLARGLRAGEPVVVIATPAHRRSFVSRLAAEGIDVAGVRRQKQLVLLDARRTLERFMLHGMPDARRFRAVVGGAIAAASARRPDGAASVCAYGEMVDLLWRDGNEPGALALEVLWNDLAASHRFSLLCAYALDSFPRAAHSAGFEAICAQHSHVAPARPAVGRDDAGDARDFSLLQQRARALAAEIEHREALELHLLDAVRTLRQREEDLREVLENAADGIHLVGADGVIQWANRAELELLGYRSDEYVGRHISEFHVDCHSPDALLGQLTRGEAVQNFQARLRHRDGSIRHVSISSNGRYEDGQFVNTRCFTRDITAIHAADLEREALLAREQLARGAAERATRLAEQARIDAERSNAEASRARMLAEQANRAKSEFLAVMSHELRTPLNAIGGYAELMELGIHGPVTPSQRESLERIQRSGRLLLGLVNQVLNYARIETGSLRYNVVEVSVDEALNVSEGLVAPQVRAKGMRFINPGCDPAIRVLADGDKLQQVMLNLLTNAVKFTDPGGTIELAVAVTGGMVQVVVSDTGIGIADDKQAVIFDPFVQVDANYTRTRDGVGLGLAISRDLARGMGGELQVESREGMGSVFTVSLRRAPAADAS